MVFILRAASPGTDPVSSTGPLQYTTLRRPETHRSASTGAVTFIQRIGSALNLDIHFLMLLIDGEHAGGRHPHGQPCFKRVKAPNKAELERLVYPLLMSSLVRRHGYPWVSAAGRR